jgi:hypothetical protein
VLYLRRAFFASASFWADCLSEKSVTLYFCVSTAIVRSVDGISFFCTRAADTPMPTVIGFFESTNTVHKFCPNKKRGSHDWKPKVLTRFVPDLLSDCFRQLIQSLFVPQENGLDLIEVILDSAKPGVGFVLPLMRFCKVCKELCLVVCERGLAVDEQSHRLF